MRSPTAWWWKRSVPVPWVADAVGAPAGAKVVAAGGQLADEVVEFLVVGMTSGFRAQDGGSDAGGQLPVKVETAAGQVKELEAGQVCLVAGCGVGVGVEGAGQLVGGQQSIRPLRTRPVRR